MQDLGDDGADGGALIVTGGLGVCRAVGREEEVCRGLAQVDAGVAGIALDQLGVGREEIEVMRASREAADLVELAVTVAVGGRM